MKFVGNISFLVQYKQKKSHDLGQMLMEIKGWYDAPKPELFI